MPWKFEFTETFREKAANLPQIHQKLQVKETLESILSLDDPRNMGGPYLGTWAYIFGSKSIIQCDINESQKTAVFTNIIL